MFDSVRAPEGDIVTAEVRLNGRTIPDEFIVHAITTFTGVNRIPRAEVVIADGSPVAETFGASEADELKPGAEVEIKAGYHAKNQTIFKGVVTRQTIRVTPGGESHLILICHDKAVAMTVAHQNLEFHETTDGEAISALFGKFGLSASVASTSPKYERRVMNGATAWDYAICRADANGMIVTVADGKATVARPDFGAPKLSAEFGDSIADLEIDLDAGTQLSAVAAQSWDYKTQAVVSGASSEPSVNKQGDIDGKKLAEVLSVSDVTLSAQNPLEEGALKTWADAALMRSRLSRYRGTVRFPGNAGIAPGQLLDLSGLGKRFTGAGFVSAVEHSVEGGSWITEVTLGLGRDWFAETNRDATGPVAAAQTPGVTGLRIATVKKIDEDPQKERRVQVVQPLNADSAEGIWVRLASPYATKDSGFEFLPEIGDEVVIGFLDGDPDAPIMLGALHSSARPSPVEPDAENKIKAIVSRAKMKISFDDVDTILKIETPGGHVATLSDKEKTVTITDSNGNKIEMAEGGITMTSVADINISAPGTVSISGDGGVNVTSAADVSVSGMNVSVDGDTAATVQGGMSAGLSSGGETSVSGTMVMIN